MTARPDDEPASRAPYRDRLQALADGAVEPHLDAWAEERGVRRTGPWRRSYGKLRPGRSTWAVLVYDAPGVPTLAVRLAEPDTDAAGSADEPVLGRVTVAPAADDPALPGLRQVLDELQDPVVVRYHPGERCTVRGGVEAGPRFVKVFGADEADAQEEACARWAAFRAGELTFSVAEPFGWDEDTRAAWSGVIPGRPLEPLLGEIDGVDLARRVGTCLGELAASSLRPARSDDAAAQLARTRRQLARGADAVPALRADLDRVLEVLARAHEDLPPRELVPIHGAAHLGQFLVDDDGELGLCDFDRFARGEPEFDLATFCIELRGKSSSRGSEEQLEEAVLDGFRSVAGEPDPRRLALYRVHKQLSRVARSAAALRTDGEERARRYLDRVAPELEALV